MRKNAGYVIQESFCYKEDEIVLGEAPACDMFVTWQVKEEKDYFHGHYFESELEAYRDFYDRSIGLMKDEKESTLDRLRKHQKAPEMVHDNEVSYEL